MTLNFQNLFHADYWLKQPIIAVGAVYWTILGALLALLALGFAAAFAIGKVENFPEKLFFRLRSLGFTMGFLGLALLFARQENIALFGLRAWFLVWFLCLLVWAGSIGNYVIKRVPIIRAEKLERARREKYLGS